MGTVMHIEAPGKVTIATEPDADLTTDSVRVKTLFSGISAGTELTQYRGTSPYLAKRWDPTHRLFVSDTTAQWTYPLVGPGYEESGEIIEVGPGTADLAVGQRIWGSWGHRSHAVVPGIKARPYVMPAGVDPKFGIFGRIGAISLNGILDAGIILGETVAVFGLGVIGQLVCQMARLSGARVVAVDLLDSRLELATRFGAHHAIKATGAAEEIKRLTGGRGADVCIESSGSTHALNEAVRACAYNSKVVAKGFYQGHAAGLFLGEEFHHNRVQIICSQISGVRPDLVGRWNPDRLAQTFMGLVADGRVQVAPLITHLRPFAQVASLFETVAERPEEVVQAVISFDGA